MFFAWDVEIPAGTLETNPVTQTLKLSKGVITGLWIKFPSGCAGLVKVRILRSEFQLVPLSKGEWVTGDDETIPTETFYDLEQTPAQLKFLGCSPGSGYAHKVTVRVTVLPKSVASMIPVIELLTALLSRMGVR